MRINLSVIALTLSSFLLGMNAVQVDAAQGTYRAAVLDYAVANRTSNQPIQAYVLTNANKMVGLIEKAKKNNADIVVFPELGTMATDNTYYVAVPDPKDKIIPADNSSIAEVLRVISKAARTNKIYVVINVHENFTSEGKTLRYNTNVAFDRSGTVIARYRKYNLFDEDFIDRTKTPEHVYFDTDFGVRFGMFICFDILFERPAMDLVRNYNIRHFVYSTAWYSELPFLTAVQAQNAFAYGNDVTLLASGLNDISRMHFGSGIYRGRYGTPLTWESQKDGTTLIVGDLPKSAGDSFNYTGDLIEDIDTQFRNYVELWQENMTDYNTKLISPSFNTSIARLETRINDALVLVNSTFKIQDQLCRDNLCCTFDITIKNTYLPVGKQYQNTSTSTRLDGYLYYRMAVANGVRGYPVPGKTGQQVCGVISCINGHDVSSCARPIEGTLIPPYVDDPKLGKLFLNSTVFDSVKITGNFTNKKNVLPTISTLISANDYLYPNNFVITNSSVIITSNSSNTFNDTYQVGKLVNSSNIEFTMQNKTYLDFMTLSLEFNANHLVSGGIYVRAYHWDELPSPNSATALSCNGRMNFMTIGITIVLGLLHYNNMFPSLLFKK